MSLLTSLSICPGYIYTSFGATASLLTISKTHIPFLNPSMATGKVQEVLPDDLNSTSEQPTLFDGTTRLYTSYICPFAQRVWIARNYKGLQDDIKLVPIDLQNRPAWYKEKVYPTNKVPALEHNNEIRGESLDLVKYIDSHFKGPALLPDDPAKREFAEDLLSYSDTFYKAIFKVFASKGDAVNEIGPSFDYIESALSKFVDGPFFLGQFSLVDIAYAPFIERAQLFFSDVKKHDITAGRPKFATWIEELNKIEAYVQTRWDAQVLLEIIKTRQNK
ncbi:glutathione S-transferase L3-like isoform X2 [Tasmannia lanceolata]|uniref:glutathione S-transferase L3-like isoform X2 n=1 Tax=Tasmannia lanceolata TaxID=3420 RepID=UPI0040647B5E